MNTVKRSLFLSERNSLERCCVHNMSPFVSSSGLSPGSREAKVQRAKVCLNCTEPSVARSSYWSLPVPWYGRFKGSVVVLARSSSCHMRVMNCNWSATKQRLHPQSVAKISRHSVLSGDRIRQCETSSGSRHKDTDQCL